MEEKTNKSDLDLLSELSSTISKAQTISYKKKKDEEEKTNTSFKTSQEINDYIQKRINEALEQKLVSSTEDVSKTQSKNEVKKDYDNTRKASATGKHAGVNSFIRNLGTVGYGEERNSSNISKLIKKPATKSDSKISDNILKKIKEREKRFKKNKNTNPNNITFTRLMAIDYKVLSNNTNTSVSSYSPLVSQQQPLVSQRQPLVSQRQPLVSQRQPLVSQRQPLVSQQQPLVSQQQPLVSQQQPLVSQQQPLVRKYNYSGYNFLSKTPKKQLFYSKNNFDTKNKILAKKEAELLQFEKRLQLQAKQQLTQYAPVSHAPVSHAPVSHAPVSHAPVSHAVNKSYTSFVFIMPAYNTGDLVAKIFNSIKSQVYSNYRIIYINDCSHDNTIEEVEMYKHANSNMNITLINNKKRGWPAYSRYIACKQTRSDEVCIFLDGDDWLVDNECLSVLNNVYKNKKIHATFGSMINADWQYKKWKKYKRTNINDCIGAYFPHLRTTRASIVKAISPYYMQTETNEWLHVCTDVALFMAVIEATGDNGYVFLKNEFVHYNTTNHSNNSHEGYNNSKNSDMRLYYRSTISEKVPMKKIV